MVLVHCFISSLVLLLIFHFLDIVLSSFFFSVFCQVLRLLFPFLDRVGRAMPLLRSSLSRYAHHFLETPRGLLRSRHHFFPHIFCSIHDIVFLPAGDGYGNKVGVECDISIQRVFFFFFFRGEVRLAGSVAVCGILFFKWFE